MISKFKNNGARKSALIYLSNFEQVKVKGYERKISKAGKCKEYYYSNSMWCVCLSFCCWKGSFRAIPNYFYSCY